ncbi:MAG: hypothetical protein M3Q49_06280 [Actinomycetota bacterium]|jgi:hypothetical protein|nr:hypothetical protein [Actinomycetota bacterium]MDP9485386.1 hypothetical protein [Actinomycetota bacterium]
MLELMELPRGVWRWLAENGRDLGRIATAAEKIADELAAIRKALQEDEQKEQNRD